MDKTQHYKTIDKTCYAANSIYLVLHLFYLILFIITQLYILVAVDAAVIVIYLLFFLLLRQKKYYPYALCCGNVFFAFVSVTTVMLGFGSGFHFYLIGLCVVSFFTTYFSRNKDVRGSLFWVGLSLAIYLTLYFVTKYNAPYYQIPAWLETTLFVVHAAVAFGFVAAYMLVFVRYAVSLEKKIMNESRTDELTQINNRYALYDYFEETKDKTDKVLALFDIDDFKNVNDVHGHVTGDQILKRIAEVACSVLSDAFVCRYGGEEFVLVLDADGNASFYDQLENLRKTIEQETFDVDGTKINVTITIGVSPYLRNIPLEKWVELADQKMYIGKYAGKNRTII